MEEMPPFPERESSLLAKLRKTAPKAAKIHEKALPPVDTVQEPPTTAAAQEPLPISINEVSHAMYDSRTLDSVVHTVFSWLNIMATIRLV